MKYLIKTLRILFVFLFSNSVIFSQNLVENPSFENYDLSINEKSSYWQVRKHAIDNWTIQGCIAEYCSCKNDYIRKRIINDDQCHPKYQPQNGCKMMGMGFETGDADNGLPCEDYVYSKLKNTLQIGKVYEISAWFYFPKRQFEEDTILCKHVGFQLLRSEVNLKMWDLILNNNFLFNKIEYDKWIQLKYTIRPICELNYIILGYFKDNDWPKKFNYRKSYYFLDNVSVIEKSDTASLALSKYFCKENNELTIDKKIDSKQISANIYFEKDSFSLSMSNQGIIDSFIIKTNLKNRTNLVLEINGYADISGNEADNLMISTERSNSVKNYISTKYHINNLRIIAKGNGEIKQEIIQSDNRKVILTVSNLTFDQICYKEILKSLSQANMDSTNYFMKIWFYNAPEKNKIITLFDHRLQPFRESKYWVNYLPSIQKNYSNYDNPRYAYLLDSLYFLDQKYRTLEDKIDMLCGDKNVFQYDKIYQFQWDSLDKINTIILSDLIEKYGFPKESDVGSRQLSAISLVLEHSNDTSFIAKYINNIEENCKNGTFSWQVYCNLFDRYMLLKKLPQVYGTQYIKSNDNDTIYKIYNHIELQEMNQKRANLGLHKLRDTDFEKVMYLNITHLK